MLGILPLATAAAAAIVARERPSLGFWLASVAGTAIFIAFVPSQREARTLAVGNVYLFITVPAGAFGYALSGRLSAKMPGWEVMSWQAREWRADPAEDARLRGCRRRDRGDRAAHADPALLIATDFDHARIKPNISLP